MSLENHVVPERRAQKKKKAPHNDGGMSKRHNWESFQWPKVNKVALDHNTKYKINKYGSIQI